jgi:septum formation protein
MTASLILASTSKVRRRLLEAAGVTIETVPPRVDEETVRLALEAEGAGPRDVADALAEMKARRIGEKRPEALVLGCDQVLDLDGTVLGKPPSRDAARAQLLALRGKQHRLLSAAVAYENGAPVWRHVGVVRLTVRPFSDAFLDAYLERNWPAVSDSAGAYHLEGEGVRLMSRVDGDYFSVLGLPLVELLSWLTLRGTLQA